RPVWGDGVLCVIAVGHGIITVWREGLGCVGPPGCCVVADLLSPLVLARARSVCRSGGPIGFPLWRKGYRSATPVGGPIVVGGGFFDRSARSEEHTSELQSRENLVCRLLLEKKKRSNCKVSMSHVMV